MTFSRRELGLALAASAAAQQKEAARLSSRVYQAAQTPYEGDEKKKGRRFFYGAEHSGFMLEVHETILGTGVETHAPHKHEHEEIVIVVEGTAEACLGGKLETAPAGSVIFMESNQMHSLRNVGKVPCRYYIVELRGREA